MAYLGDPALMKYIDDVNRIVRETVIMMQQFVFTDGDFATLRDVIILNKKLDNSPQKTQSLHLVQNKYSQNAKIMFALDYKFITLTCRSSPDVKQIMIKYFNEINKLYRDVEKQRSDSLIFGYFKQNNFI